MENKSRYNRRKVTCPDCGSFLNLPNHCTCGWVKEKETRVSCTHRFDNGAFCATPPSVSQNGKWYCHLHHNEIFKVGREKSDERFVDAILSEIYKNLNISRKTDKNHKVD